MCTVYLIGAIKGTVVSIQRLKRKRNGVQYFRMRTKWEWGYTVLSFPWRDSTQRKCGYSCLLWSVCVWYVWERHRPCASTQETVCDSHQTPHCSFYSNQNRDAMKLPGMGVLRSTPLKHSAMHSYYSILSFYFYIGVCWSTVIWSAKFTSHGKRRGCSKQGG